MTCITCAKTPEDPFLNTCNSCQQKKCNVCKLHVVSNSERRSDQECSLHRRADPRCKHHGGSFMLESEGGDKV